MRLPRRIALTPWATTTAAPPGPVPSPGGLPPADREYDYGQQAARDYAQQRRADRAAERAAWEAFLQGLIGDYYRIAFDELSDATPTWQTRKWARMEQTRNVIAKLTKRDTVSVLYALEHGMEITLSGTPCIGVRDADGVVRLVYRDGRRIPVEDRLAELRERHQDHR